MAEQFYTIVTDIGKAKIVNSTVLGKKINLATLKVGDGNGSYYNPTEDQEDLVNTKWSGAVGSVSIDKDNPNWIVIETVLPATIGGFTIREVGIFDDEQDLIAITKCAETYKPVVSEGTTKEMLIRTILEVSNASSITLKIDPTVILATKKDIQVLQLEIDDLDQRLSKVENDISNDNILTQNLSYGMNGVIKNVSKNSISPKFTIQGKTLINLLGKDGNCEDVSKWNDSSTTHALDSSNRVFGSNGMKITLTASTGMFNKPISAFNIDITKYYLLSAYIKNGNATNIQLAKNSGGGGNAIVSTVTDATKFNRVGVVIQPSDFNAGNAIGVIVNGASGQYAYVDGIMINEITASEYALGATALLANYPYVDSYTCLQNPYVEIRHDNLVRNGNGEEVTAWWNSSNTYGTLSIVSSKFQLVTSSSGGGSFLQKINVKANTNYYLSGNVSGNTALGVLASDGTATLKSGTGTFNTGSNTSIYIAMTNASASQTGTADSIMLVEGTTAPSSYKTCRLERVVLETKLTSDDSITYDNGEVTGQIWWKHRTLYGKDYDWQYLTDYTGYKSIVSGESFSNRINAGISSADNTNLKVTKYNGSILLGVSTLNISDGVLFGLADRLNMSIADTDTGWAETINPNNDEVKAFMNGWKAQYIAQYSRYVLWVSIVDGTYPSILPQTTVSTAYTANSTTLVVADASKFSAGDKIIIVGYGIATIGSISGNTITLSIPCGANAPIGAVVVRTDDGSSDTRILSYCKNNVAPGYEGYQLHHKLANPEPITDDNCHIHGDIPLFDVGDNYLYLDNGMVLGEVANPVKWTQDGNYYLNDSSIMDNLYMSKFKYKVENILTLYKNLKFDTFISIFSNSNGYAYGNGMGEILASNFDSNATYTVDYKILATQTPQVGNIACSYVYDIVDTINKMQEEINNRQEHDSILDTMVDLSLYEKSVTRDSYWTYDGTTLWIGILINATPKKCIPSLTINNLVVSVLGTDVTKKFNINSFAVLKNDTTLSKYMVSLSTTDATVISNLKTNGSITVMEFVLDCRGRI